MSPILSPLLFGSLGIIFGAGMIVFRVRATELIKRINGDLFGQNGYRMTRDINAGTTLLFGIAIVFSATLIGVLGTLRGLSLF